MTDLNPQNADLSGLRIDRGEVKIGRRRRKWLHILWLLIPFLAYFAYGYILKTVAPAVKVKVAAVRRVSGSEASAELVATGYVVAQTKAAVSSKATGRLKTLNVEEGDIVKSRQVLAELENDDIKANLDLYRAYLKRYRADSLAASLHYNRQIGLLETGHATAEVVELARARFEQAAADVEAGIAQERAAEIEVENTIIRAPFDGTVLTKNADVGEMVAPLAASASSRGAVVTIADMTSLEVETDVSESNIQKVIVGQPCEIIIDANPNKKYQGFVKKIVPTADRSRATVMVKVAFRDIDERVLPEMSARVNFLPLKAIDEESQPREIMVVDNDAIVMRDGRKVAFVFDNGYARKVSADFGRQLGDETEVIDGLSAGMRTILNPPGGLNDGDKVELSD